MNIPVFDLHCDTALAMLGDEGHPPRGLRRNDLHIDLTRASALAGYCQCFACFTTPFMEKWGAGSPVSVFRRELEGILAQLDANADLIALARSPEDIRRNLGEHRMSAVLTIEGPAGFGYDPARLEELYGIGFRITTLGWNESNPLTGSHMTGGGLTDRGREFVREAQRLGMLIDVSHISDEGFWDIMDITRGPVIASHSNSRRVFAQSRNLTDDMFLAICQTGGVAGFNQYAGFVGQAPDLNTACDHVLHFMELDPTGRHIALGGDLDGCEALCDGFRGVQDYPAFARHLLDRGLDGDSVKNIFWNNAIGVMENVICNNPK